MRRILTVLTSEIGNMVYISTLFLEILVYLFFCCHRVSTLTMYLLYYRVGLGFLFVGQVFKDLSLLKIETRFIASNKSTDIEMSIATSPQSSIRRTAAFIDERIP